MPNAYDERCAVSGLPIAKGDRVVVTLLDATPEYALRGMPGHIGIGLPFECSYDGEGWFGGVDTGFPGSANLGALANAAETYVMPSGDPSPAGDWETFSAMAGERQEREIETQAGIMVVRADVQALMLRSGTPDDMALDGRASTLSRALTGHLAAMRAASRGAGPGTADLLAGVDAGRLTTQFLAWLAQSPERLAPDGDDAGLVDMVVAADAFERAADALGIELAPSLKLRAGVDWDRVSAFQDGMAELRAQTTAPAP